MIPVPNQQIKSVFYVFKGNEMTFLRRLSCTISFFIFMAMGNIAYAGIPVIDGANLAQAIMQVQAWAQQYQQMVQQFQQLQQQYSSLNGVRGMANLVNNPALRQYLPADYSTILNSGYGNWAQIRATAKLVGIENTSLNPGSDAGKAFEAGAKQAALNRATSEDAYAKASQRFNDIQVLLDKVNDSPDAKDMADLQGRIQAEQVMMQNESVKLAMLGQLAQAQRDLQQQQSREISIKALSGSPPRF